MNRDYRKALEKLTRQEEILQFDSFSDQDAWNLGCLMREEIHRREIELTFSIRKVNGHIVFACSSAGSNANHQNWIDLLKKDGQNKAYLTADNTARQYGYDSLEEVEKALK